MEIADEGFEVGLEVVGVVSVPLEVKLWFIGLILEVGLEVVCPVSVLWGIDYFYLRHRTVYSLCHASIILELFYILVLITVTTMVVLVAGRWLISTGLSRLVPKFRLHH